MVLIKHGCQSVAKDGTSEAISEELKEIAAELADELLPTDVSPKAHDECKLGIHEFLKNVLHGDNAQIDIRSLPDGTVLLNTTDQLGEDHLDPAFCGHQGEVIIRAVFGEENLKEERSGNTFRAELHVIPKHLLKAVGF